LIFSAIYLVIENQLIGALQNENSLLINPKFPKHTSTPSRSFPNFNKFLAPQGVNVENIPEFMRLFPLDIAFSGEVF